MTTAERVAVLVVRAWIEGDPPRLTARITRTVDVTKGEPSYTTVSSAEQIYAEVRRWLEEFEGEPSGDGAVTRA